VHVGIDTCNFILGDMKRRDSWKFSRIDQFVIAAEARYEIVTEEEENKYYKLFKINIRKCSRKLVVFE